MTILGYTSRNIPNPQIYADMLDKRMSAKKSGDMVTANALKLVANTTYGAMLNKYNDLFDPLMGRSVCITGQLFLLELANHLRAECETLVVVQINTDGIMVSFDDSEYSKVLEITKEWEQRTGFELEEDKIKSIRQKDTNNYIEVPLDGKPKIKGGYLVRGIAPAGAFNINNNATVVAKAIVDYFVQGTPPEETINSCNDIFAFQIIAKAGSKYKEAYHIVDGEKQPIQKVNRVYATADERYGKLFKVKAENGSTAKIEMLPEHCIIDNENKLTIEDIDKSFYIEVAKKRINDFLGIKPTNKKGGKKMANTQQTTKTETKRKEMNVYEKLLQARIQFMQAGAKKSGKNMHLAFKYYELEDIVPVANGIFENCRLIPLVRFEEGIAKMGIVNIDKPEEVVEFVVPMVLLAENKGTNAVQAMGASVTYYRRYLYMIALDICEADEIDNGTKPVEPVAVPQNTNTSKPLTDATDKASELQISQLKETFKKLLEKDPSNEEWIAKVAVDTKGFTVMTKEECESLTLGAINLLNKEDK